MRFGANSLLCYLLTWTSAVEVARASQYPPKIHFELRDQVVVIDALQPGIYVPLPAAPTVYSKMAGAPAAALVHSGYSSSDPDGKVALFSLTIVARTPQLSSDDETFLQKAGYLAGLGNYVGATSSSLTLDISLPADPKEESRLRQLLKLPKTVQAGSAVPVQIRWEGRDGQVIYDWLTKPDGLNFVLKYDLTLSGTVRVDDFLPIDKRTTWWDSYAMGNPIMQFNEGTIPLALDLLKACGSLSTTASLMKMSQFDGLQLSRTISFLNKILKHGPSGTTYITKADLLGLEWDSADIAASFPYASAPRLSAGAIFISHPELVKDLSGTSEGLGGLITTSRP